MHRFTRALLALPIASAVLAQERPIEVRPACPAQSACAVMTVDALAGHFTKSTAADSAGFTTFLVHVRGNSSGQPMGDHDLRIRGYTGGIGCGAFGQATVAVIGHSRNGEPIILTSGGPFVIADSALIVGCPRCAHVSDTQGKSVLVHRTPGQDLPLAGTTPESLMINDDGVLFLNTRGRWLAMPDSAGFRFVPTQPAKATQAHLSLQYGACS